VRAADPQERAPLLGLAAVELRWLLVSAFAAFAASVVVVQLAVGHPARSSATPPCPGQALGQGAGLARVGALGHALSVIEFAESALQPPPVEDRGQLAWSARSPRPR